MKKIILVLSLSLLVLPAFAQEDEYARFQGVWIGIVPSNDDFMMFIFEDDSFIWVNNDGIFNVEYVLEGNNMLFKSVWTLSYFSYWEQGEVEEEYAFQYIFSADKLILVINGVTISCSKGIKDIPKRWPHWFY
jgi:hypothetical protein